MNNVTLRFHDTPNYLLEQQRNGRMTWLLAADHALASARVMKRIHNSTAEFDLGEQEHSGRTSLSRVFNLYGQSIECLFKALWLDKGNQLIIYLSYCGIIGARDHRLEEMANATGFRLAPRERAILFAITRIMLSKARHAIEGYFNNIRFSKCSYPKSFSQNQLLSSYLNITENIIARLFNDLGVIYEYDPIYWTN